MLLETAYSCLNRQCLKERKEMQLFQKFGLFPPFSPCRRLLFKDSFSPSDISVSEFISHKKHDICFLFYIFFKVTVNFLISQHFLLLVSAGEHRTNLLQQLRLPHSQLPEGSPRASRRTVMLVSGGLNAMVEHLTLMCRLLYFLGQWSPWGLGITVWDPMACMLCWASRRQGSGVVSGEGSWRKALPSEREVPFLSGYQNLNLSQLQPLCHLQKCGGGGGAPCPPLSIFLEAVLYN